MNPWNRHDLRQKPKKQPHRPRVDASARIVIDALTFATSMSNIIRLTMEGTA
jgi:hypothetical protein